MTLSIPAAIRSWVSLLLERRPCYSSYVVPSDWFERWGQIIHPVLNPYNCICQGGKWFSSEECIRVGAFKQTWAWNMFLSICKGTIWSFLVSVHPKLLHGSLSWHWKIHHVIDGVKSMKVSMHFPHVLHGWNYIFHLVRPGWSLRWLLGLEETRSMGTAVSGLGVWYLFFWDTLRLRRWTI